jgi:cytochrome c-type biogenesis protein CcmF
MAVSPRGSSAKQQQSQKPYINSVLLLYIGFFLSLLLFAENPFNRLWRSAAGEVVTTVFPPAGATALVPADGQGLNPQLQNYWMVIHPVTLYLGFVGMTVPFAFAVAALITGQLGNAWIKMIRKWALAPWLFLSLGILLGSQWAYIELGWGGYWAWDPVENASFLPWLTATAFIHSIMIQERRGMLKVWNMVLIWMTWELTLIGTFLTRSGVVQSVHSFALSAVGPMFAAFIIVTMLGFLALLVWRLPLLKSENQLDAVLSRETSFLTQNVIFVLIMAATFLGTIFPSISELVMGDKVSLNAPYFNRVNGPIFLALLDSDGHCSFAGVATVRAGDAAQELPRSHPRRIGERTAAVPARQPQHGRVCGLCGAVLRIHGHRAGVRARGSGAAAGDRRGAAHRAC